MIQTITSPHQSKLNYIQEQLELASLTEQPVYLEKGGVSHFVPLPEDHRQTGISLNLVSLDKILSIDPDKKICVAEPSVSFDEVVQETLRYGLIPAVVPELKGITLGGAVAGCAIESASFRHGTFHDTCLEYEILTSQGEKVICSPSRSPLLFHMMHGSYGTLGILTCVTFRLVSAMPYVYINYLHFRTFAAFQEALFEQCRQGNVDFIDGIIHAPHHYVLCLGSFVSKAPYTSDYNETEIYYKSTLHRVEDYLTTADYCFRYDTECHWLTRNIPLAQTKWFRQLAGPNVLGSTNLIKWSKRLEWLLSLKRRPDVVCDVFIPSRNFQKFYSWYEDVFNFYPLWIVPGKLLNPYPWLTDKKRAELQDEWVIDCAVYGKPNTQNGGDYSQLLEEITDQLGGIKTLISSNHYTKQHFWEIYDQETYQLVKRRLDPLDMFPELYSKFHKVEHETPV